LTLSIDVDELEELFEKAWSKKTSAWLDNWREDNSAWGQCVATALIIQDYFGGEILCTKIDGVGPHCWNRLPHGVEVDLTRCQFPEGIVIPEGKARPRKMFTEDPDVFERYKILKTKIETLILEKEERKLRG